MPPPQVFGLQPIVVDKFSGLNTLLDATALPTFASPATQDTEFVPGLVRTRPGLTPEFTPLTGNPTVNYLKTYIQPDLDKILLAFDSMGILHGELTAGTLTDVSTPYLIRHPSFMNSATQFGREYQAIGDGQFGIDIPRQYDKTNFDRVSQGGPGAGPDFAADVTGPLTVLSRTSGIITAEVSSNVPIVVGGLVTILGQTDDPTFNGTWPVETVAHAAFVTSFTAWGEPGIYPIGSIIRKSGVVTATLASVPFMSAGDQVIIAGVTDKTFNGLFTSATVDGNIVTWAQALPDSSSQFGTLYTKTITVPLVSILAVATDQYLAKIQLQPNQVNPFIIGLNFIIAGNNASSFNTTWPCLSIGFIPPTDAPLNPVLYTSAPGGSLGAGGFGGTATLSVPDSSPTVNGIAGPAGSISSGIHQVVVIFVTRNNEYATHPSPPTSWLASGGFTADVFGIPVPSGLSDVTSRIVAFTAGDGDEFFYTTGTSGTPNMVITDPTVTELAVDFSDTQLLSGTPVANLFTLVPLQECSGVTAYASRLVWTGERNVVTNFLNLAFDGGWKDPVPLGWTADPTNGVGTSRDVSWVFGPCLNIIGDGVSAIRGMITQSAYQDYLMVPIIMAGVGYSVRVRTRPYGRPLQGNLEVELYSPTMGSFGIFTITAAQVNVNPTDGEYIGVLTTGIATPPSDLVLRLYVDGTPTGGNGFQVAYIEPFPTNTPFNVTQVRISRAADPESYDAITGTLTVAPENGQACRTTFTIRDFLYIVKEHSLYVTSDQGGDEPSTWTIREVSSTVGSQSVRGVGLGDEWAIIAGLNGIYLFDGGQPQPIADEIRPTWNVINWDLEDLIQVTVDIRRKRAYISAPLGDSTTNNVMFVLDYTEGFGDPLGNGGIGRKWTIWNISSGTVAIVETNNNHETLIGNGAGNGKIYLLDDDATSDDGAAINSFWQSGYAVSSTRAMIGYVSANIIGAGVASLNVFYGDQNKVKPYRGWTLTAFGDNNRERQLQVLRERLSIKIGSNDVNHKFSLQGLYLWVNQAAHQLLRGRN